MSVLEYAVTVTLKLVPAVAVVGTLVSVKWSSPCTPVPLRLIVCVVLGLAFRLVFVSTREPLIEPAVVGAQLICSVQLVPAANIPAVLLMLPVKGQVPILALSSVKFVEMAGLLPLAGIGKLSAELPLLAIVTVRAPSMVSVEPAIVAVAKLSDGASAKSSFMTLFALAAPKYEI